MSTFIKNPSELILDASATESSGVGRVSGLVSTGSTAASLGNSSGSLGGNSNGRATGTTTVIATVSAPVLRTANMRNSAPYLLDDDEEEKRSKRQLWIANVEMCLNWIRLDIEKKEKKVLQLEPVINGFPCHSTKLLYEEVKISITKSRSQMEKFDALVKDLKSLEERFDAVVNDFDKLNLMKDVDFRNGLPEMVTIGDVHRVMEERLQKKEERLKSMESMVSTFPSHSTKLLFSEVKRFVAKVKDDLKFVETLKSEIGALSQRYEAIMYDVAQRQNKRVESTAPSGSSILRPSSASSPLKDVDRRIVGPPQAGVNVSFHRYIKAPTGTARKSCTAQSVNHTYVVQKRLSPTGPVPMSSLKNSTSTSPSTYVPVSRNHSGNHIVVTASSSAAATSVIPNKSNVSSGDASILGQLLRAPGSRSASNEDKLDDEKSGNGDDVRPSRRSKVAAIKNISGKKNEDLQNTTVGLELPRNTIKIKGSVVVFECPICRLEFTDYYKLCSHIKSHTATTTTTTTTTSSCSTSTSTTRTLNTFSGNARHCASGTLVAPSVATSRPALKNPTARLPVRSRPVPIVVSLEGGLSVDGLICAENAQIIRDVTASSNEVRVEGTKKARGTSDACSICNTSSQSTRITVRYGIYSCDPCADQYVSYLKAPTQLVCYKDGSCKVAPVNLNAAFEILGQSCQACWLKKCLASFNIDSHIKEMIIKNYPPKVAKKRKLSTSFDKNGPDGVCCIVCDSPFKYRSGSKQNHLSMLFGIFCCDRCDDFFTKCANQAVPYTCKYSGNCDIKNADRCKACWLQKGLKTFDVSNFKVEDTISPAGPSSARGSETSTKDNLHTYAKYKQPGPKIAPRLNFVADDPSKRHACKFCGATFVKRYNCQYHMTTHHPLECDPNDLTDRLKLVLKYQLNKKAGRPTLYPACGKRVPKRSKMRLARR